MSHHHGHGDHKHKKKPAEPVWDSKQAVDAALAGKQPDENPFFLCVVAPPDCGKGTLIEAMKRRGYFDPKKTVFVTNAIIREHPVCKAIRAKGIIHPEKDPEVRDQYYAAVQEVIHRAAAQGYSIVYEEHPDHMDKIDVALGEVAKSDKDYEKVAIGMALSKERYFGKIKIRKKKAEHSRRLGIIGAMSSNWEELATRFDYSQLWYSRASCAPLPVGEWNNRGEEKGRTIYDTGLYEQFKQRASIGDDEKRTAKQAWKATGETPETPTGRRGMERTGEISGGTGARDWRELVAVVPGAFERGR